MGYSMRYYGGLKRADLEELQRQYPNANISSEWVNLFVKGLVKDALEGKLTVENKKKSTKELLEEQRLKNLRKQGALLDLTIWEKSKDKNIALTVTQLADIGNGTYEIPIPTNTNNVHNETQPTTEKLRENQFTNTASNIPLSCWDEAENRFVCYECNPHSKFEYRLGVVTEMINVVSDFTQHVYQVHNRKLNDNENKIINEYLDIVNKSIVPTNEHFDQLKESLEKTKNGS